ncbi:unnamed protein product [Prunus brigantina]
MTTNPNCHKCLSLPETMDHVFRGCRFALKVWNFIKVPFDVLHSFSLGFTDWLRINLKSKIMLSGNLPWTLVFTASMWHCWKWRCNSIFNPGYEPPPNPHHTILQFSSEWLDANNVVNAKPTREVIQVRWSLPTLGNFKLNVDGSCKTDSWKICAGGLLRDSNGAWICGFSANIGIGNIYEAELWSLFRGLHMAWDKGIRSLDIECDSLSVVSLIAQACNHAHPLFCLIEDCKLLLKRNWRCNVSHIYREQNRAADHLANLGYELPLGLHIYESAPISLSSFLLDDEIGRAQSRAVPC